MRGLRMSWVVAGLALMLGLGRAEAIRVHVIPEHPTAADPLKIVVEGDFGGCSTVLSAPQVLAGVISIRAFPFLGPVVPDCDGAWAAALDLPALQAGSYDVHVEESGTILAAGSVVVNPTTSSFQGELTVSPRLPTSQDLVQLQIGLPTCVLEISPPEIEGDRIVVRLETANLDPCPPPPAAPALFSIGPLPVGDYKALYVLDGNVAATQSFSVVSPVLELDLLQKRFRASIQRGAPSIASATAVRLTEESGYFWFFDRDNVEVTLKMLDGRSVNGHFWVYAASMTDLPFTLTITDLASPGCDLGHCATQTYSSPAGKNTNFLDINAF